METELNVRLIKLGIFTITQANNLGLSQQSLSRLAESNEIKRVAHGVYLHPDAVLDQDLGFQIAFAKFGPEAAIGGLSALYHYYLAEQVPRAYMGTCSA